MYKPKLKIDQSKLPLIITSLVIISLLISGLVWWGLATVRRQSAMPCTDNKRLLEDIGSQLDPSDPEMMEQARATINGVIANFEHHQEDYNCVYPITVSNIYFGDIARAREYLEILKQLESEGQTSVSDHFGYAVDISAMEAQIASREQLIEDYDVFGGVEIWTPPLPELPEEEQ